MFKREKLGSERVATIVILVLTGAALLLKLINVFNAPAHWDTGIYLNMTVGYLDRGILTPLMWRFNPEWNVVTGSGSGYGIFLLIGWVKLFGISVLSGHLLMYVVGMLNLPVIYVLARRFYSSPQAGLWAVGFFALSGTFAQDFYARMDAANILVCSLVLLLHLEAIRRDKWWLHFAVGIALVAALEFHLLAALYTGGIGLYYAVNYLQVMRREKRLLLWTPALGFGIGLVLGAAVYFLHHIAPNPDIYFMIQRNCDICIPLTPYKEIERWYLWVSHQPLLLFFMITLAIVSALLRRSPRDRDYLLLLGGSYIAFLIINPPVGEPYTAHTLPLFALGVGGVFAQGLNARRSNLTELRIAGLFVCITALIPLLQATYFTYARSYLSPVLLIFYAREVNQEEYPPIIDYIRANIPTDTVIVGHETYYLDLVNYHNYLSLNGIEAIAVKQRHETYFGLWQREKPQVFIVDVKVEPEVLRYMAAQGDFVEVLPKLWVKSALVSHFRTTSQTSG